MAPGAEPNPPETCVTRDSIRTESGDYIRATDLDLPVLRRPQGPVRSSPAPASSVRPQPCRGSWRTIHMSPLRRSPPIAIITAVPALRQQAESQRSPSGAANNTTSPKPSPGAETQRFPGVRFFPNEEGVGAPVFGFLNGSISTRVDGAVEKSRFRRWERAWMTRLSDSRIARSRICRIGPGDNPQRFPIR